MRFKILDGIRVERDGRTLDLGPRPALLLAVLLSRLGEPVTVPELVDAIWYDHPPASAVNNLRGYIQQLRKVLGPDRVVRRGSTYRLVADVRSLDAGAFTAQVAEADAALLRGELEMARDLFRAAMALWRGRPFGVLCDEPSLAKHALRLEEQRLAALERCYDVELELGADAELVPELAVLAAERPYQERLHGQLMLALHRCGRQADALKVYQDLRATLVAELGIEPGRALHELQLSILRNESPPARAVPAAAHGRAPVRTPAELPQAVTHFSGRADELKRLDELATAAEPPALSVVTVVGPPGVGKTALVVHWAHDAGAGFPDGLIFVDLRGFHRQRPMPPPEAIRHLLTSLGVAANAVPSGFEDAVALYRSTVAGRRILIVLDNAGSAEQVRDLLPGSPAAAVVVTSRNLLTGLTAGHGARRLALQALTADDAIGLLSRVLDDGRVSAEPAAAAALVEACDRLPLAVCITAANLAEDPARDIATHLDELRLDRLAALEVDGERDFRLAGTFDQSYDALDNPERRTFRLLGVLPGHDFTAPVVAAATASTVEQASHRLGRLTRAHLVEPRSDGRYALHDLLREYARRRAIEMDAGEAEATLSRLYSYYLRRCDAAARALYPQIIRLPYPAEVARDPAAAPVAEAVSWLNDERDNLVAACLHAAGTAAQHTGWHIADLLRGYFWGRGFGDQWYAVASSAAVAAASAGDLRAHAMAELSLGNYHQRDRDVPAARDHYAKMLLLSRAAAWPEAEAAAESASGALCTDAGDLERSVEHFERSLEITIRAAGRPAGTVYNNLAGALLSLGHLAPAEDYCLTALSIFRAQGALMGEALILGNLALVLCLRGSLDKAREHAIEALRLADELDQPALSAYTRVALATVGNEGGDPHLSQLHAQAALDLAIAVGDVAAECQAHNALAPAYRALDRVRDAITHHEAAQRLAGDISNTYVEIESMMGLATVYLVLGEPERAVAFGESAVARARGVGYRVLLARALATLSGVHRHLGRSVEADEAASEATRIQRETGCRLPWTYETAIRSVDGAAAVVPEGY